MGERDLREGGGVPCLDSWRSISPPSQNIGPEQDGGGKETWEEVQQGCSIQVKSID